VGGTPEVVANGETGYLVPPGDPGAMSTKVVELLRDPDLRRRMGVASRERMSRQFTFEAQADAYLKLFERLIGERARVRRPALASRTRLPVRF
jgi:glycosyltransferase involved in cell wall biosynthesis